MLEVRVLMLKSLMFWLKFIKVFFENFVRKYWKLWCYWRGKVVLMFLVNLVKIFNCFVVGFVYKDKECNGR